MMNRLSVLNGEKPRSAGGRARTGALGVAFFLYLSFILDMTLRWFPRNHPPPNLTLFDSMREDWALGGWHLFINFFGNIIAFVPLGVLLSLLMSGRASAGRVAGVAGGISAAIEVTQYLSGRRVGDVDDVILNASGALLGYLGLRAWRVIRGRKRAG